MFTTLATSITLGCNSNPAPQSPPRSPTTQPQTPARPTVPPPPFKVFHQDESTFTLVTNDNASDEQIEALIWQLRDAAHAHALDTIKISQKAVDEHKPTAWFHVYRGTKCASEKYAPGAPPCGGSYHAAGDYTFGSATDPAWDQGTLLHGEDQRTYLWDPDVPYGAPKPGVAQY